MPFLTALHVTLIDAKPTWRVDRDLVYWSKQQKQVFTIQTGFKTDFASVPRLPLVYLLAGDTAQEAAVVHDWLYTTKTVDRKTADSIFLEAMQDTGIAWWRRRMMHAAVRAFGESAYDKGKDKPERDMYAG